MKTLPNYFWLVSIGFSGLNAVIFWVRAQRHIQKNPELRPGYIRLIRGFFLGMSAPWVVMGAGLETGSVSNLTDYFDPRAGNPFVIAWWISIWILLLFLGYWIWFQGGAEQLIQHPGLLRGNPKSPKEIKLGWLLLSIVSAVAHGIIFFLKPR